MSGFRTLLFFIGIIAVFAVGDPSRAIAAKRIALVVGIDKYSNLGSGNQLQKAVNDARAIGGALREIGFEAAVLENPTRAQMSQAIGTIEQSIGSGDTVFFFFSGHGVDFGGANYLLPGDVPSPVDAQGRRLPPRAFRDASFNASEVLASFQERGAGTVIAVFDACREAFGEEAGRSLGVRGGLAEMRPSQNMFILFSAGAKQTALDRLSNVDPDPNSVFTRSLLPILKEPGRSLVSMAKALQPRVSSLAMTVNHVQNPAYYDQIEGEYYLVPCVAGKGFGRVCPDPVLPSSQLPPPPDPCANALAHWKSVESIGTKEAFVTHINSFPNCPYAELARLRIVILTTPTQPTPAPSPSPDPGDASICNAPGSMWVVDGSSVILKGTGGSPARKFYYCRPGSSASVEGAVAGNLLFSGQRQGNSYAGTAYVNAGRCGRFSYSVTGSLFNGEEGVTLYGSRPVVDLSSCKITSYRSSELKLSYRQRL